MSVLVGGVAGASSRLSGGLVGSALTAVSDVQPMALQRVRPAVGPSVGPTLGRFRRHFTGITTDDFNLPLANVTVKVFDAATDVKVADLVSDAAGVYDAPLYVEGTYYAYSRKAGTTNVFGATDIVAAV